jgi:hypothetical protein
MRAKSSWVRRVLAAALAACACLGVGSANADNLTTQANRLAYDLAVKCFVANGVARGNSRAAHDEASAAKFEKRARQSFDVAGALGDKLGYSGNRQTADFEMAQSEFLPKFVTNPADLRQIEKTCESVGL